MARRKYRPAFFDVIPVGAILAPELPAYPGALKLGEVSKGMRLKIAHKSGRGFYELTRYALCTVTDERFKDHRGEWHLEVVFDRHVAERHPELRPGEYKSCCYQDVKAADLGLAPYADKSWNQSNYCVPYVPES